MTQYTALGISIINLQHAVESIQRGYNALNVTDAVLAEIAEESRRLAMAATKTANIAEKNEIGGRA